MHGAGGGRPRKDGTPASTTWERQLTTFLLKKRDSTHLEELQTDIELLKIVISRLDKKIITALEAKQDTSHKEKPFV